MSKHYWYKTLIILMVAVLTAGLMISSAFAAPRWQGQTLRLCIVNYEVPISKALAPEFEKITGAKLELYEAPYGETFEKIMTGLITRAGAYDIIGPSYDWLGPMVPFLLPLDDYFAETPEIPLDDYVPGFINRGRLNDRGVMDAQGKLYAYPFDGDIWVLYIRQDLFAKEGITVPDTWEDYIEVADHFTRDWTETPGDGQKFFGTGLMYDKVYAYIGTHFTTLLAAYKGSLDPMKIFFDEDLKPVFNDAAGVKALSMMKEFKKYAPPGVMSWQYAQSKDAFYQGKTAMLVSWQSVGMGADNPSESGIVGKWRVAPIPKGVIRASADGNGRSWAITKDAADPDLAWEWIKFWADYDRMIRVTRTGAGMDPARRAPYFDPELLKDYPWLGTVWESIKVDVPFPVMPETPRIFETLSGYLQSAVVGEMTSQKALDAAAREWEYILEDAGYYD